MRTILTLTLAAVVAAGAAPLAAQDYDHRDGYQQDGDRHDGDRRDGDRRDGDRRDGDRHDNGRHNGWNRDRRDNGNADYRASSAYWQNGRRYDWNRPDPRANGYYADRYYRDGRNYQPRYLSANERIYRGNDGRYYCRRNDGTTGLIIGAVGGGVLGDAIAPGGSKTVGTLAGGVLGALLGQSIDRGNQRVQCR